MKTTVQVAIVGAGFAGLGAAIRLKLSGRTSFVVFERANEVGGTWRENTYPGCACDVPSHLYSYSFAPNPNWSKAYSPQPEIQRYIQDCVTRFELRDNIRFNTEITDTRWLEKRTCWQLTDQHGNTLTARVLVMAIGPLNRPSTPALPGLDTFTGTTFHSARWNHDYDLTGKRVAVVGTGASAIQIVPEITPKVAQLSVYQRTAPYINPRNNRTYAPWQQKLYARIPALQQLHRGFFYWMNEFFGLSFVGNNTLNKLGTAVARKHLEAQISDPELRRKAWPDYKLGCKRVLVSDDYFPALTQPHVELVTDPIRAVTPTGILTADGRERPLDAIIFSTGFVVADIYLKQKLTGRNGRSLLGEWAQTGAQALNGLAISGFPNLIFLMGPNTGLGHNSIIHMIESQLNYLIDYISHLERADENAFLDVKPERQRTYNEGIQQKLTGTVWASGCQSWYMNGRGQNTTIWPDLTVAYRKATRRLDPTDYTLEQPATTYLEPAGPSAGVT